ncbi:unnamed protein product [Pedinophyceae sp. YPF-701]|nr:unnamed protein product [Pedinophyceae sp. YPF-701]
MTEADHNAWLTQEMELQWNLESIDYPVLLAISAFTFLCVQSGWRMIFRTLTFSRWSDLEEDDQVKWPSESLRLLTSLLMCAFGAHLFLDDSVSVLSGARFVYFSRVSYFGAAVVGYVLNDTFFHLKHGVHLGQDFFIVLVRSTFYIFTYIVYQLFPARLILIVLATSHVLEGATVARSAAWIIGTAGQSWAMFGRALTAWVLSEAVRFVVSLGLAVAAFYSLFTQGLEPFAENTPEWVKDRLTMGAGMTACGVLTSLVINGGLLQEAAQQSMAATRMARRAGAAGQGTKAKQLALARGQGRKEARKAERKEQKQAEKDKKRR